MKQRNAIVFATDARLFPAAAFQTARLVSLHPPDDTDIVIATDSAADIERATKAGLPFRPWLIDPGLVSGLRMEGVRLSPATYYRVFLPRMLADEYSRLLYIDVDIYLHSDRIFGVFGLPMNGRAVGAVRDPLPYRGIDRELAELRRTIASAGNKYLNAGVLLIDAELYAAQQLERRILEVVSRQPLWLNDQSALNIVLDGNWLELSPAFNMLTGLWNSFVASVCDPVIVHFTGSRKPWHGPRFRHSHAAKAEMEMFFPSSPWPNFLAGFYGLKEAMEDLQTNAAAKPRKPRFNPAGSPAYLEYLRSTTFADVEAGLTDLRRDRIPAGASGDRGPQTP